jgi:hypothetical protein
MTRRWLPGTLLCGQTAKRKHNTESKKQRLHHNPHSETGVDGQSPSDVPPSGM